MLSTLLLEHDEWSKPHPDTEERADRFVVTGLQVHVTAVVKLLHTAPPPEDTVTPGRDSTLPTVDDKKKSWRVKPNYFHCKIIKQWCMKEEVLISKNFTLSPIGLI